MLSANPQHPYYGLRDPGHTSYPIFPHPLLKGNINGPCHTKKKTGIICDYYLHILVSLSTILSRIWAAFSMTLLHFSSSVYIPFFKVCSRYSPFPFHTPKKFPLSACRFCSLSWAFSFTKSFPAPSGPRFKAPHLSSIPIPPPRS